MFVREEVGTRRVLLGDRRIAQNAGSVPNSHSQDVLEMEYAVRRAFKSLIIEFDLNLNSLLFAPFTCLRNNF